MLAVFPLTTARGKTRRGHCRSLGSPDKFLCTAALKRGSGLAMHTSGFDCNWLKVIIVKKVIVFSGFVGLSISCYTAWFSDVDFVVTWTKGVHNCRVTYEAPALVQRIHSQTMRPPTPVKPTGSKTEGRPMRVNEPLRMELTDECVGKRPAFLTQERPRNPSLSTKFPLRHSVVSKFLTPVRRAIAIRSSPGLSRFQTHAIGKASDQAAMWLFCAVSSRLLFQFLGVPRRAVSES